MIRYAVTIFLSAFMLFQVQPLMGKFIFLWFGGSPAVWTACMMFFQVVLLAGYSYAHWVTSRLSGRTMAACHLLLLLASLAFLPIRPEAAVWKTVGSELPIGRILALLTVTIGLPYFLLSTTGPLLQESFRRETGKTPYRLYSLSNVGSLLALLTYPFVFEPQLLLGTQIVAWSCGYAAFVVLCAWCTIQFARLPAAVEPVSAADAVPAERPGANQIVLWLALAACGSLMLLATTNQLCQEVTSVPFLWVLPLSLYLLSFIICFDHERWYHRNTFLLFLTVSVLLACYAISKGTDLALWKQLAIYSATLWSCCMVCHGELVRSKPAPRYATLFYLMVSAGGALGGIFVALIAPLVLRDFWEYHIGLIMTVVLAFFASFAGATFTTSWRRFGSTAAGVVVVLAGLAIGWTVNSRDDYDDGEKVLDTTRNFYGVLRVKEIESEGENGRYRKLIHGRIEHGIQWQDPEMRRWPTTYYGEDSGVGLALLYHPRRRADGGADTSLRIGVVGLGCGTIAAYGEAGDYIRFYEINPEVERISNEFFSYRKDCPAQVDVILGDARIVMEHELAENKSQQFDVLVIDAFSSDAIPMHLLTKESVTLFRDEMKPDGLLCLHISNRFLDLSGVVLGIADAVGLQCRFIDDRADNARGTSNTSWAILTNNQDWLNDPELTERFIPATRAPIVWTDDYGSLWQVIERGE